MSGPFNQALRMDLRGGLESALQGIPMLVTPSLLFVGILGQNAAIPGLWGTLMAITLVPLLRMAAGGAGSIIAAPRIASTATYVALVLTMGLAASNGPVGASSARLTVEQLRLGLAAASLMYLVASLLILLSGLVRLGRVFKMIPTPVTTGISNGTAMLLLMLAYNKASETGLSAAGTALVMVLASLAWSRLQLRLPSAKRIPGVLVVIALGLLMGSLWGSVAPAGSTEVSSGVSAGLHWTSLYLWPSMDAARLGVLVKLGVPGTITLALVMVLETFTAAGGMEIRFGVRTNPDRELLALGAANIAGALIGGIPCSGSPVYSFAAWLAGGRGHATALCCFILSGTALVFFNPWLMALPGGLAAGLLVLQALMMVSPTFIETLLQIVRTRRWQRRGAQDMGFWIAMAISLVGFFGNLIWATFAGVGLSCLAVLRRVSANLTAHWLYLDSMRSRRMRTAAEYAALTHLAHHVGILRLTGHLFFGNSGRMTQLADELDEECACVVVDISLVHDVDPSGRDALAWLVRALCERGLRVVVAGLAKTRIAALRDALGQVPLEDQCVDLDRGLELCEEWLLQTATALPKTLADRPLESNSLLQGLTDEEITAMLMVAELREVAKGEVLFRKDERSDGVWMLQSGQVSILAGAGPTAMRLATFGPGQFVGEMGFIDGNTRSATATADAPVSAVLLDNQGIAALVRDHPEAALKITRNIARELSQRVRTTSAVLAQEAEAPTTSWGTSVMGMVK